MDDAELVHRINELADEEHRLERSHAAQALSDEERERLRGIEVALDQCWDLLRQRRARRSTGLDPDEAAVRPADVVENYQQ
jgi:predicted transcriptional regulator